MNLKPFVLFCFVIEFVKEGRHCPLFVIESTSIPLLLKGKLSL